MSESIPELIQAIRRRSGWSQEELAREVGVSFATINRWQNGHSYPNPANLDHLLLLGEPEPTYGHGPQAESNKRRRLDLSRDHLLCDDGIAGLSALPDESVHLILSDIPYGIAFDDWDVLHRNTNSALRGSSPAQKRAGSVFKSRGKPINGWSSADKNIPREYYDWCSTWAAEWLRVLKPGGSAIVFAGRRFAPRCVTALEDAGFNFRDLLGWTRPRATHRAQRLSIVFERRGDTNSERRWRGWRVGNLRPRFEPIIWCFKPYKITIADNVLEHEVGAYNQDALLKYFPGTDNIFECSVNGDEGRHHVAQKPVKLLRALIELVTQEGQVVLDPFAGSGSTAVAAKTLSRRFVAFEIDPATFKVAKKRLAQPTQGSLV